MGRKRKVAEAAVPVGPPTVHVIGAGGVGFWLVTGLARTEVRPVVVYDTDNLSGGLGHMRLPSAAPSTQKIALLRGFLAVNFPGGKFSEITFKSELFTGAQAVAGDLIVDCSDMSGDARRKVFNAVRRRKARYVRVSYDGAASVVVMAEGLPLTGDETHAGYSAVPSLALSLMAGGVGAEVIAKTDWATSEHIEFQIGLAEIAGFPAVEAEPIAA